MLYLHKTGIAFQKMGEIDLKSLKCLKDESWLHTHRTAILNQWEQQVWFESITKSHSDLILMAHKLEKEKFTSPIGVFKIDRVDWISRSGHVGWDIFQHARGKGLGKLLVQAGIDFVFEVLNLRRIDCEILSNNFASKKCAEGAGFILEGRRRCAIVKCRELLDSEIYGVLRSDWVSLPRVQKMGKFCNNNFREEKKNARG